MLESDMGRCGGKISKKFKKPTIPLIVGVLLAGVVILLAMHSYQHVLSKGVQKVSGIFLEEISYREVTYLENNLEEQFDDISVMLTMLSENQGKDIKNLQRYLDRLQTSYGLQLLALIDDKNYYCSALEYKPTSSGLDINEDWLTKNNRQITVSETVDGQKIVLSSLPIEAIQYGDKNFVAIVVGTSTNNLVKEIDLESGSIQTRTSIMDKNGMFVVYTCMEGGAQLGANLFSVLEHHAHMKEGFTLDELRGELQKGQGGMSFYELNGEETLLCYTPVAGTDWFLLSAMPYQIIDAKVDDFMNLTVIAGAVIILVICSLLVVFLLSLNRARAETRRAEHMGLELVKAGMAKKQVEEALRHMAYYDELTGIANKNYFLKSAYELLAKQKNYTYVILNIRKFKVINDLFGFARGDLLLRHMAKVLQESMSQNEICARFTSDEFHLLLIFGGKQELRARLSEILKKICDFSFDSNSEFHISVSTGVYILEQTEASVERMGDFAKLALQKIKDLHGAEIYFYNEEIRNSIIEEQEIETDMQHGIDNAEFVLYLQPKYEAKTERLAGAEALVRWQHPIRGLLPPGLFIPIFEKNGFITKLDFYMLEAVCRFQQQCLKKGHVPLPISINQSRLLLYSEGYIQQLVNIVESYRIPFELVELEVTESVFLEDKQRMVAIVDELHRLGFSVSMDDFGSGYSTLNMLKEIMVDELKIDKDFFSESTNSQRGKKIVSNIISMARDLEIQVVAEGVETLEQCQFLREAGCDLLQGYYYSKPIPSQELEKQLNN